jgi:hypothetical protein
LSDRPVWTIKTCQKGSWDVSDWQTDIDEMTILLTEEEKKSKYAKYFYLGPAEPSMENRIAATRGQSLKESEVYMPEEYAQVMNSDAINRIHTGYRVMDNGIGFAVVRVRGEGVSDEKVQFFLDHFNPEGPDLFYKIWFPGAHMRHYFDIAVEDVGCGMEFVKFLEILDGPKLNVPDDMPGKDRRCIAISGGNGASYPLYKDGKEPHYAIATRYTREIEGGRETIMTFWYGLQWKDGKSIRMIPEDERVSEEIVRGQVQHGIWELSTEMRNILLFWEDWHNGYFEK